MLLGKVLVCDRSQLRAFEYPVAAGSLGVLLLVVYSPVLTNCYGLQDDYIYLWVATFGPWQLFDLISAMGRPLYQILSEGVFSQVDGICQLTTVRAFTLMSVLLLGVQLYYLARRSAWSPSASFVIAWLVCTSSSIGLFVGWAITFPFVLAMSMGLVSGELIRTEIMGSDKLRPWRLLIGLVLLYLSLTIYQHSAMGFWLAWGIATFTPKGVIFWPWRRLFMVGILYGLVLLVYYFIFRWHLAKLLANDPAMLIGAVRTGFVTDFFEKIRFLKDSLLLAASPGRFLPTPWLAFPTLTVVTIGLLSSLRRPHHGQTVFLWLILPFAVYLPSVVISESLLKVRLVHVLCALLLVYLIWALHRILNKRPVVCMTMFVLLSTYSGFMAHENISRHLVGLQKIERSVVLTALKQDYKPSSEYVAIVRPPALNLAGGDWPLIEYAIPTSAPFPDFARVMVQQQYAELFDVDHPPEVVQCPEAAKSDCPELLDHPELRIIDINELLAEALLEEKHLE